MTADGGGVVWSAAQKGVKGMDLGDLERAVGGGSQPEPEPEPGAGAGRRKAPQAVAEEKEAREKAAMIAAMKRRVEGGGAKEPAAAPLTPAQQAVSQIKAADALLAEGRAESLETALGLYRAALAHFGRRPKLEQKIAEVEGRLGAEGGRR